MELVAVARRAVALPGQRHQHGIALGLLSVALTYQAEASGSLEDLSGAIDAARRAVAELTGHPDRALHLHNLAKALLIRYEQIHSVEDLDESIDIARLATTSSVPEDPREAGRLALLAAALERRYQVRQDVNDLLGAAAAGEAAVLRSPPSSAERLTQLSSLSNVRRALAEHTQQLTDADAAIEVAEQALSVDGNAFAIRSDRLLNVASCHVVRFRITDDLADIDRAVSLLQEALARVPELNPDRCAYLSELAQRLVERHAADRRTQAEAGAISEAIRLLREAASLSAAPVIDRVRAAGRWGLAAAAHGLGEDAAAGYAAAVHLLPLAAWHGLDRSSQERQLKNWNPLVTSAAAWAVELGRPAEAVELLEEGRGVLWAHQLGRRADLRALRAVRPDLTVRLEEIRAALDV
jgi:tetratricopeptide (TPR) repeat protein